MNIFVKNCVVDAYSRKASCESIETSLSRIILQYRIKSITRWPVKVYRYTQYTHPTNN